MSAIAAVMDRLAPIGADQPPRTVPRSTLHSDPLFRIIDVGLLNVLPLAKVRGTRAFYVALGFENESIPALRDAYGRHDLAGVTLDHLATIEDFDRSVEQAAGCPSSQRFDCVSMVGGASGRRCLDAILGRHLRPAILHCADQASFADWPTVLQGLKALRYHPVGELSGAMLLIDGHLLDKADARGEIATFDVFDTLIARRCIEPWRVFERVAKLARMPEFVAQRRQAEGRVLDGAYTMDDIYDELARHTGLNAKQRRALQDLELACEFETVIPIAENLAKVRDGDLLVSDMYLSEAQIRRLLRKAGLTKQVGLVVESHGKSAGRVWPLITRDFKVRVHLGDNQHADAAMPARHGIPSTLTATSGLTDVEHTLDQVGLRDLVLLCREARLTTWHDDPGLRDLQLAQVSLNLPILLLASVCVARLAQRLDSQRILFCSRDGNLWLPLFDAIQAKMGHRFDTRYFLTSRMARKAGSAAYLDYAREEFGSNPLVVDLCGTGWSMGHLAERLGRNDLDVFLIDRCPPLADFERSSRTPQNCRMHTMLAERPAVTNIPLELANAAAHGMVVDMRKVAAAFTPVIAPSDLPDELHRAIEVQRAAFTHATALAASYKFADVLDLDDASLALVCRALYVRMADQVPLFARFIPAFERENQGIVRTLVLGSASPDGRHGG